jgi:aspartyl-tRNA(Asn)/glutamyl-tRNA(Gln) amidotransferase subunit B
MMGEVKISNSENDLNMMCGLEIHVQLNTNSKLFCDCKTNYQEVPPNTNICPVCLNQPGAKPYPANVQGLKNALMIALMLNCKIDQNIIYFLRKHYNYPDLPSGYQRTSLPIGYKGKLNGIRIREIHIEEDPGQFKPDKGIVDFNRSGIPLVEIVTEPDIFSPEQARTFLRELIRVLKYSESARGEGTMRADVNISLDGGKRVEIKNINSIRGAYKALKFEMVRQKNLIKRGIEIQQETRAFVESQMITVSMRLKEDADDYRFIPDPDLPPIAITSKKIVNVKENMPEAPHSKVKRFIEQYNIDEESANVLTSELDLADAYEEIVKKIDSKFTASWMRDELKRVLYYNKIDYKSSNINPNKIIQLLELLINKEITTKAGQRIVEYMVESPNTPIEIAEKLNLIGIVSNDEVINATKIAIEENPEAVDDYYQGKKASMNFLVGQVMKQTKGKADPQKTVEILKNYLNK